MKIPKIHRNNHNVTNNNNNTQHCVAAVNSNSDHNSSSSNNNNENTGDGNGINHDCVNDNDAGTYIVSIYFFTLNLLVIVDFSSNFFFLCPRYLKSMAINDKNG